MAHRCASNSDHEHTLRVPRRIPSLGGVSLAADGVCAAAKLRFYLGQLVNAAVASRRQLASWSESEEFQANRF